MKTIALQTNLMPAHRVVIPYIPKAGLSLILAIIGLAAGGIMIQTILSSENDWNEFVACAKTLSVARCQTTQMQTCAPRVPTGPWTFNSH